MKEPPKHITEQQCSNCTHFTYVNIGPPFDGTCNCDEQIYDFVCDDEYCIFHITDDNKKPQKIGTL